jgi:hypothetical protein
MNHLLVELAEKELRALRVHEALALFDHAERSSECDPDLCAAGRWQCHMLLGDFESAWRQSDLIKNRGRPDPNRFWGGRPLEGKRVLIRCLHGLGDTIQFIRYAPLVQSIASSVTIEAQPKLKRLLEHSGLADSVITWSEPEPPWDEQVEVMELPRIFRSTLETIPRTVPYLRACDTDPIPPHRAVPSLAVGVAWCSSTFNPARSIPLQELAALFDVPGISFFGLQSGPEHTELSSFPSITDLSDQVATLHDTARVLEALQLIITVDTMTAHLAGALGVPVWTMLPYECDWRWMLEREDSPWYPTMRLFRQSEPGDWSSVVIRLKQHLEAHVYRLRLNGAPQQTRNTRTTQIAQQP